MEILITTIGRQNKQKALQQIPEALHSKVWILTQEEDVSVLRQTVPKAIPIHHLPTDTDGIAQTRQRAIDYIPKGKVWVIDDLCIFKERKRDGTKFIYTPLDDKGYIRLYNDVSQLLDTYIQVGISSHNGNNRVLAPTKAVGRAYSTYGLRTDVMQRANIRFDAMYRDDKDCKYMEDFYITLDALTKGYANTVIYDRCFTYQHNTAGGNSTNRTLTGHAKSAAALHRRFPQFVKLVQKEGKWGTQEMDSRTEVQVQWKQAFHYGHSRRK